MRAKNAGFYDIKALESFFFKNAQALNARKMRKT